MFMMPQIEMRFGRKESNKFDFSKFILEAPFEYIYFIT